MVNHARTLLLNINAETALPVPGDDYIEMRFIPLQVPSFIKGIHQVIFGVDPDMLYANYRAWECMKLIHSTEYASYILALDSRFTYDPVNSPFSDDDFGVNAAMTNASNQLDIIGTDSVQDNLGRATKRWKVYTTADDVIAENSYTGSSDSAPKGLVNGRTEFLTLPGSLLRVSIVDTVPADKYWFISSSTRPSKSWVTIDQEIRDRAADLSSLFGNIQQEPYKTFYGLWKNDIAFNDRITGLLLAMIYRLEECRVGVLS